MSPRDDPSESSSSAESDSELAGGSATSTSFQPVEQKIDQAFIDREEKQVRKVRWLLAFATLACAAAVSVAVYISARQSEQNNFEHEYEIFAADVLLNVGDEMKHNIQLLNELSVYVTSVAVMTESVFPNLTLPHFDMFTSAADGYGGFLATIYAPIVQDENVVEWEAYVSQNKWWANDTSIESNTSAFIFDEDGGNHVLSVASGAKEYAPIWHISPPVLISVNENLFADSDVADLYSVMKVTKQAAVAGSSRFNRTFDFLFDSSHSDRKTLPHNLIATLVYDSFSDNQTAVGILVALMPHDSLLNFFLPDATEGIICVFRDSCGHVFTYQLNGHQAIFLGYDDFHDPAYDRFERIATLDHYEIVHDGLCQHDIHVYPSSMFEESYTTSKPALYTSIVAFSFLLMAILIVVYDFTVTRRQEKTMRSALRSGQLIASLFPENVRDRLLNDINDKANTKKGHSKDDDESICEVGRPIAEFFAGTTVMFADISGFTAWSSTREPFQVFELLETIYGALDLIAKRRRIFKVETIGDCYVAVCGIPNARPDHAVAMAKFARACLDKMNALTKRLEVKLGPDTASLEFRVGLHSGPVTGGVLRGDNARFQLFGDTVNTAARMESTGFPNRIHVSQATADLLIEASKGHWVKPREDLVTAKGKGVLNTFWLTIADTKQSSHSETSQKQSVSDGISEAEKIELLEKNRFGIDDKTQRLVDWNKDLLLRYLKQIVARRESLGFTGEFEDWNDIDFSTNVFDEVAEIITLPNFSMVSSSDSETVAIDLVVEQQLFDYVASIASMYRSNSFHNFDHASHVTMSVVKMMGRIVPTSSSSMTDNEENAQALHDHTYGIVSDPLTQFACIFAALIHDVDHEGVPNAQLVKENTSSSITFQGKSVAEQHSLVLAWNLLMKPDFSALRQTLCATFDEVKRFRQLAVNAVMATDIMAADLKALRNRRWAAAFSTTPVVESVSDTNNRKATIVIEHLIQASDVCHTMQHWHVYRKWNERLFMEMSKAYAEGRAENNPADTWYKGEIGFFDFYIIPLAKKLAECGVFGVSSDEFLSYAMKNRAEWEARGEDVVREMVDRLAMSSKHTNL